MRIVIVDDDRLCTEFLKDSIKEILGDDTEITTYTDSIKARDSVGKRPKPDIIFLDIEMPGVSGIEIAKCCKEKMPDVHIVFVTSTDEHALTAWQLHVDDYLLKPAGTTELRRIIEHIRRLDRGTNTDSKLKIRCFGKFEVFYNDVPLKFKRSKAKELLAYLIAARGAGITSGELCGVFWDDAIDLIRKKTYIRQYTAALREALRGCGCEDVLIRERNSYAIDVSKVDCDYYRFLNDGSGSTVTYMGEFMTQYDWAEEIEAQLSNYKQNSHGRQIPRANGEIIR